MEGTFLRQPHNQTMTLLIGKYHVRSYSPTGRGGKGYFAYVVGGQRLVFLKLLWRPDSTEIDPEHETYARLHAKGVQNIPRVIVGEDVCHVPDSTAMGEVSQPLRTLTQDFLASESKLLPRLAYRLVIETLGIPLSEYSDSYELTRVVLDAVEGEQADLFNDMPCIDKKPTAHEQAWERAEILHRDISIGNIIIDIDSLTTGGRPKGLLCDWDLSKSKAKIGRATQTLRSVRFCSSSDAAATSLI